MEKQTDETLMGLEIGWLEGKQWNWPLGSPDLRPKEKLTFLILKRIIQILSSSEALALSKR